MNCEMHNEKNISRFWKPKLKFISYRITFQTLVNPDINVHVTQHLNNCHIVNTVMHQKHGKLYSQNLNGYDKRLRHYMNLLFMLSLAKKCEKK